MGFGQRRGDTWTSASHPRNAPPARRSRKTGIHVTGVEFVAITNDVLPAGRHYITIWMRADSADVAPVICDEGEIAAAASPASSPTSIVHDLSVDDGQHAHRPGQCAGRHGEDVLR